MISVSFHWTCTFSSLVLDFWILLLKVFSRVFVFLVVQFSRCLFLLSVFVRQLIYYTTLFFVCQPLFRSFFEDFFELFSEFFVRYKLFYYTTFFFVCQALFRTFFEVLFPSLVLFYWTSLLCGTFYYITFSLFCQVLFVINFCCFWVSLFWTSSALVLLSLSFPRFIRSFVLSRWQLNYYSTFLRVCQHFST